jgi:thymidine phosphorylase
VDIKAAQSGIITSVDARRIGLAVIVLGGGRKRPDDVIDASVGFDRLAGINSRIEKGDSIARIHANSPDSLAEAQQMLLSAYQFGNERVDNPLIIQRVTNK